MTEKELLYTLKEEFDLDLTSTDKDQYCRWDAQSDKYLVELKSRRAHYDTQLIEYDKLECVKTEADKQGKDFLYVTYTPKGLFVFNASKLCREDYDFKWEDRRMPSKTDFAGAYKKDKKVGYLHVNDADIRCWSVESSF